MYFLEYPLGGLRRCRGPDHFLERDTPHGAAPQVQ
uniref:Uncharacterized protein n=1 Tax=Arundo donax TaxID=35708 RepID=A0A0A9EP46_ARUDO